MTVFGTIVSRAVLALALTLPAVLALAGCAVDAQHVSAAMGSSSKPYQEKVEDPVNLTAIRTIAVVPFDDRARKTGFDAEAFADALANQLAALGQVRIIYPAEILQRVDKENRDVMQHNARLKERIALGLVPPEQAEETSVFAATRVSDSGEKVFYNPIKNQDEAVRLARRAKADAVIVGEVTDYDPYMRPRMGMTMRLIATGSTETAAQAIAELTQWGVPRTGSGGSAGAGGVVYLRQQTFDSTMGSVGVDVSKYGYTHFNENNPYGTEVYMRSMNKYYDVVANQLALAFADVRKKAVKEAEDRAKALARSRKDDQDMAMNRLVALMNRDMRIPDYETDSHGEAWFDQAFMNKNTVIANGGDKRIMSFRPDGRNMRQTGTAERWGRDMLIPENERGRGLEGYSSMVDSQFPDADAMMEMNMGGRDGSFRPDYYNKANPQKSASMYDPREFVGARETAYD